MNTILIWGSLGGRLVLAWLLLCRVEQIDAVPQECIMKGNEFHARPGYFQKLRNSRAGYVTA